MHQPPATRRPGRPVQGWLAGSATANDAALQPLRTRPYTASMDGQAADCSTRNGRDGVVTRRMRRPRSLISEVAKLVTCAEQVYITARDNPLDPQPRRRRGVQQRHAYLQQAQHLPLLLKRHRRQPLRS